MIIVGRMASLEKRRSRNEEVRGLEIPSVWILKSPILYYWDCIGETVKKVLVFFKNRGSNLGLIDNQQW